MTGRNDAGFEDLLRLAEAAAAPKLTSEALREFGDAQSWQPRPGQLWRAVWDETNALVLVLEPGQDRSTVVPATVEPTGEDKASLVLEAERMRLAEPVTLWAGLIRAVPTFVLDQPIEDVGTDVVEWCLRPYSRTPSGTRRGLPAGSPAAGDAMVRALVEDDIDELAGLESWAPVASPAATARPPQPDPRQLQTAVERLGITLPELVAILRGQRTTSAEQRAVLFDVLGWEPAVEPLDPGIVTEMNSPRWRRVIRRYATKIDASEWVARQRMAYEVVAMATRAQGEEGAQWGDRLDRWVRAQQLTDEQ